MSATEWLEETLPDEPSWRLDDTVKLAEMLAEHGVDLLDVSSSGNHPKQWCLCNPWCARVPSAVRGGSEAPSGTRSSSQRSGRSTKGSSRRASWTRYTVFVSVSEEGKTDDWFASLQSQADVVFVGRMLQKNPGLVWTFADDVEIEVDQSRQIGWAFQGRPKTTETEQ